MFGHIHVLLVYGFSTAARLVDRHETLERVIRVRAAGVPESRRAAFVENLKGRKDELWNEVLEERRREERERRLTAFQAVMCVLWWGSLALLAWVFISSLLKP